MRTKTKSMVVTFAVATALVAGAVAAAPAQASSGAPSPAAKTLGENSLAAVLTSGEVGFDRNRKDFDIATAAVLAVLADNPKSPVSVLADGSVPLTAFIPTDEAFRRLVTSLTGKYINSEEKVFAAVAGLGIKTVETVLLYHVVPGATITAKQALKSNGAVLTTAQTGTIEVRVWSKAKRITLVDKDPDSNNPRVILSLTDINKGNKQLAHGIDRVLRPVDLPKAS